MENKLCNKKEYSEEESALYNALVYTTFYFNEEKSFRLLNRFNKEYAGVYFHKFRMQYNIVPNKILSVLFYYNGYNQSFTGEYFSYCYYNGKINSHVLGEIESFKKHLIMYYFPEKYIEAEKAVLKNDTEKLFSLINELKIEKESIKTGLIIVLSNIEDIYMTLINYLQRIKNAMLEFLASMRSVSEKFINNIDDKSIHKISEMMLFDKCYFSNIKFWISYINPFVISMFGKKDISTVVLGINYYIEFDKRKNLYDIKIKDLCNIYEYNLIEELIILLLLNTELSNYEIANKLKWSKFVVYDLLESLDSENIIKSTRYTESDVHYTINRNFIEEFLPKESDDIKRSFYEKMYNTASYSSFSKIISNDMLVDILKIIKDKSSINPAGILREISGKYNLSHATLYRLINTLKEEGIIYISKEAKKNKYYSISTTYLDYMEGTYLYIINNFK